MASRLTGQASQLADQSVRLRSINPPIDQLIKWKKRKNDGTIICCIHNCLVGVVVLTNGAWSSFASRCQSTLISPVRAVWVLSEFTGCVPLTLSKGTRSGTHYLSVLQHVPGCQEDNLCPFRVRDTHLFPLHFISLLTDKPNTHTEQCVCVSVHILQLTWMETFQIIETTWW